MNGKINIVFGFIYFAATAVLGPVLLVPGKGQIGAALVDTTKKVEIVREGMETGFAGIEDPSMTIAPAVVGIMEHIQSEKKLGFVGSAAHAHGNLEALLNIAAGVVLLMLAIPAAYKKLLSLLFIIGACFHSGMLYLAAVFGLGWATNLTLIGAIALVSGLLLMGAASAVGIRGGRVGVVGEETV